MSPAGYSVRLALTLCGWCSTGSPGRPRAARRRAGTRCAGGTGHPARPVAAGCVAEAAELLGWVAGQDVEAGGDGIVRIARRGWPLTGCCPPSTRMPGTGTGTGTARRFDGSKARLGVDPADELITEVAVTAANVADREVVGQLLAAPANSEPSTQPTGMPVTEPASAVQPDSTKAPAKWASVRGSGEGCVGAVPRAAGRSTRVLGLDAPARWPPATTWPTGSGGKVKRTASMRRSGSTVCRLSRVSRRAGRPDVA
jgi:hypothetical protein